MRISAKCSDQRFQTYYRYLHNRRKLGKCVVEASLHVFFWEMFENGGAEKADNTEGYETEIMTMVSWELLMDPKVAVRELLCNRNKFVLIKGRSNSRALESRRMRKLLIITQGDNCNGSKSWGDIYTQVSWVYFIYIPSNHSGCNYDKQQKGYWVMHDGMSFVESSAQSRIKETWNGGWNRD